MREDSTLSKLVAAICGHLYEYATTAAVALFLIRFITPAFVDLVIDVLFVVLVWGVAFLARNTNPRA